MLRVKIAGKRFRIPTHWEDITLTQCAWLYHKANEQSPALLDYYRSFASDTAPEPYANIDELTRFTSEVVGYLADVPEGLMLQTRREDIMTLAMAVLPRFIIGVLGIVDYPVRGITSFRYKGRRYYLPKSGTDISGELTPLSGVTAIEFCQLSDIVCAENIALAPLAVAIVCRRKGERYNEELAQKRAALFASLPASVYWELWAQTSGAHQYLKAAFPNCYGTGGGDSSGKAEPAVWCDTLVAMSTDKPSELDHLQRMNAYDFVHLLSENIKRRKEEWKMKAALASCGVR